MKRSEYDGVLRELLDTTEEALSAADMAAAVGCSNQKAHVWIKDNRGRLVLMGTSDTGAKLYVGRDNPLAVDVQVKRRKTDVQGGTIEVGTTMVVKRLVLGEGVQVEFETEDGRQVLATLHL